jgi:hypothetical protein
MRRAAILGLVVSTLPVASASADGFVDVVGGLTILDGGAPWSKGDLVERSPKLAVRAGSVDRKGTDAIVSVDWTPIQSDAADLSAHRIRAIASYEVNTRLDGLNLGARMGVGLDFLRVREPSESDTLVGYAFEVGVFLWIPAGPVEIGGEVAIPFGLNGNATVGDLQIDSYLSMDVDLLLGVRHVWR